MALAFSIMQQRGQLEACEILAHEEGFADRQVALQTMLG